MVHLQRILRAGGPCERACVENLHEIGAAPAEKTEIGGGAWGEGGLPLASVGVCWEEVPGWGGEDYWEEEEEVQGRHEIWWLYGHDG